MPNLPKLVYNWLSIVNNITGDSLQSLNVYKTWFLTNLRKLPTFPRMFPLLSQTRLAAQVPGTIKLRAYKLGKYITKTSMILILLLQSTITYYFL